MEKQNGLNGIRLLYLCLSLGKGKFQDKNEKSNGGFK